MDSQLDVMVSKDKDLTEQKPGLTAKQEIHEIKKESGGGSENSYKDSNYLLYQTNFLASELKPQLELKKEQITTQEKIRSHEIKEESEVDEGNSNKDSTYLLYKTDYL